ncbi:hypothetical protein LCGC14_1217970 [marine sediment metagenome]|uniref:Uncharacterized protein n=1 Tax=marine sediment metagenome TaxID=412755 RepID=A0A0F9LZF5_9ZZZZ|nr:hypothetical protein [bacterium]
MKVNSIKFHIDSGISIFCKSTEEEYNSLRCAIVNYDISIISAPYKKVQEQCKIYKKDFQFQQYYFILFFPLDNIINPHESQISIKSISFFLNGSKRVNFTINKTYTFKELQKKTTTIGKFHDTYRENLQRGRLSSQKKGSSTKHSISPSTNTEETKLFVDSLKKFKNEVQGSNLENLIKKKGKALDFNLKNFGISILCKLLLLTKYVNNLVDNDFQEDLTEFVKLNLSNEKLSEVLI